MKRIIIVLLFGMCILGCSDQMKEKKEFIMNSSYSEISIKLDETINNINYFPTKECENEFIYYVKGIIDNINKFTNDERDSLYNKLSMVKYRFNFNDLNYHESDYEKDLSLIKNN